MRIEHASIAALSPVNFAPAFSSPLPESGASRLRNGFGLRESSRGGDSSGGEDGQEGLDLHFDDN